MNLLILNGDSTYNRGDRAILLGNIILLRHVFPGAEIRAFSYAAERDSQWYKIKFYTRSSFVQTIKAIIFADVIFWGGGELIQDDTSKVKIPYWFFVISVLTVLFRKKVVGLGQGLGPVTFRANKLLARLMLNRLRLFLSRDNYSGDMIRAMGARVRVIESHDPAILVSDSISADDSKELREYLKAKGMNISSEDKIVGVGVRRWFHQKSSWIPHKYAVKYKLRTIPGEDEFQKMKNNLAKILDHLVETWGYKVVFFPMYTPSHEADDGVSDEIAKLMRNSNHAFVFVDDVSPQEYLQMIGGTDLFFGIRLHSTILSTSVGKPSLTFYYVPKGKSYFEQIGIPENSFPVEDLLSEEKTKIALKQFDYVVQHNNEYSLKIRLNLAGMKSKLLKDAETLKDVF